MTIVSDPASLIPEDVQAKSISSLEAAKTKNQTYAIPMWYVGALFIC